MTGFYISVGFLTLALATAPAMARDAAFMDPGAATVGVGDEAVKVEPKGDIDTGESVVNVPRRTTLFFVNQTSLPIKVEKISVNNDGNVATEITNDDCSKQGTIAPLSRCSVEVSVTPSSPGPWSINVLLTHDGAGRIARAKLTGKTAAGAPGVEKKDNGLAFSAKETAPVNFGEVEAGQGKAVRTALMVNDSADPITLYAIDVIEADNGLQRLDQGCTIDMELKPGESCPVTLVWTPVANGQISTDLIIRHSGKLGFVVIPIRGVAKGMVEEVSKNEGKNTDTSKGSSIPSPPSAPDLERATSEKISPVSASALSSASTKSTTSGTLRLIGTVGSRAVLLLPDGTTSVVALHDEVEAGDKTIKVIAINAKSADVMIDGNKKSLILEISPELTAKASSLHKDKNKEGSEESGSFSISGSSSSSFSSPPVSYPGPAFGTSLGPPRNQPSATAAAGGSPPAAPGAGGVQ